MNNDMKLICLLDLPPPVHGMSLINQKMLEFFKKSNFNVKAINSAPSLHAQKASNPLWHVFKTFLLFINLLKLLKVALSFQKFILYRPINGGTGQVYDLVYFITTLCFVNKIYIHHHSFAYLNQKSGLFSLVTKVTNAKSVHIVLGESMKQKLIDMYNVPSKNIRIISNVCFFQTELAKPQVNGKLSLGHLSNLTVEKGLEYYLELASKFDANSTSIYIAGPTTSPYVKDCLDTYLKKHENFHYKGPLYDENKILFFRQIDYFCFPTSYFNEAEPLVLYEAAQEGCEIYSFAKGCIADFVPLLEGHVFEVGDIENMHKAMKHNYANGSCQMEAKIRRQAAFLKYQQTRKKNLTDLKEELTNEFSKP